MVQRSVCNSLAVWCRFLMHRRFESTKTTSPAPLDNASKPSAPLPANKSRHTAPSIRSRNQLKRVSLAASVVGRSSVEESKIIRRLRHSPAMILKLPAADLRDSLFKSPKQSRRFGQSALDANCHCTRNQLYSPYVDLQPSIRRTRSPND